jgi:hypothetical protein
MEQSSSREYELLKEAHAYVSVVLNCSSERRKRGNRLQISLFMYIVRFRPSPSATVLSYLGRGMTPDSGRLGGRQQQGVGRNGHSERESANYCRIFFSPGAI